MTERKQDLPMLRAFLKGDAGPLTAEEALIVAAEFTRRSATLRRRSGELARLNRHFGVRVAFEPRDIWLGVFVDRTWYEMGRKWHRLYICILPTLPLIVTWRAR